MSASDAARNAPGSSVAFWENTCDKCGRVGTMMCREQSGDYACTAPDCGRIATERVQEQGAEYRQFEDTDTRGDKRHYSVTRTALQESALGAEIGIRTKGFNKYTVDAEQRKRHKSLGSTDAILSRAYKFIDTLCVSLRLDDGIRSGANDIVNAYWNYANQSFNGVTSQEALWTAAVYADCKTSVVTRELGAVAAVAGQEKKTVERAWKLISGLQNSGDLPVGGKGHDARDDTGTTALHETLARLSPPVSHSDKALIVKFFLHLRQHHDIARGRQGASVAAAVISFYAANRRSSMPHSINYVAKAAGVTPDTVNSVLKEFEPKRAVLVGFIEGCIEERAAADRKAEALLTAPLNIKAILAKKKMIAPAGM